MLLHTQAWNRIALMNLKVSVVTPSFNQGRFIERTIQSVLSQRFSNLEYVVFDGGSTDETVSVLNRYDTCLRWVSEKDRGQTDAVNKGILSTSGDIIGWLNSDDVYYPGTVQTVSEVFESRPEIDLIYGDADYLDEQDRVITPYETQDWDFETFKGLCFICQPAVFFRRSVINRFGLLDVTLNYCMDYEYWLRLALGRARFLHLPQKLAGSRLYPETKTLGQRVPLTREIVEMTQARLGQAHDHWIFHYARAQAEARGISPTAHSEYEAVITALATACRRHLTDRGRLPEESEEWTAFVNHTLSARAALTLQTPAIYLANSVALESQSIEENFAPQQNGQGASDIQENGGEGSVVVQGLDLPSLRQLKRAHLLHRWLKPKLGILYQHEPKHFYLPLGYFRARAPKATPTISIVTPSFNQGWFLEQTINSVLAQGYPRLEYVIQDGGSTDQTLEILKRYQNSFTHWESAPDRGQTHALNLGFRHATGEIMAYLNSDDLLLPGALNYVARYFVAHPKVDVVYGNRILIDEYGAEVGRWVLPPHDNEVLTWRDYIPQETLFWRRSLWEKVGGAFDESFHFAMDWDLLLRFRDAGAKFAHLPRFLGAFRFHPSQKTSAQMADTGAKEIRRLRERSHQRTVTKEEIDWHALEYLRRHAFYDRVAALSRKLGHQKEVIPTLVFSSGWHPVEQDGQDRWRWSDQTGRLLLSSPANVEITMQGELLSAQCPNQISLLANGEKLAEWQIAGERFSSTAFGPVTVRLGTGINTIDFVSHNGAIQVPPDVRWLAFALKNLKLKATMIASNNHLK